MSFGYYRLGSATPEKRRAYGEVVALMSGSVPLSMLTPHATSPLIADTLLDPPLPDVAAPKIDPKSFGYTGNSCADCGSTKMKLAGHCEVCEECGSSTGCS